MHLIVQERRSHEWQTDHNEMQQNFPSYGCELHYSRNNKTWLHVLGLSPIRLIYNRCFVGMCFAQARYGTVSHAQLHANCCTSQRRTDSRQTKPDMCSLTMGYRPSKCLCVWCCTTFQGLSACLIQHLTNRKNASCHVCVIVCVVTIPAPPFPGKIIQKLKWRIY